MSKQKIYSIRDNKVGNYNPPMFVPHLAVVIRQLEEVTNDPKTMLCKYPQDYELYELGEFDEQSGSIKQHDKPIAIMNIIDLKKG